jgi:hypothetical protein
MIGYRGPYAIFSLEEIQHIQETFVHYAPGDCKVCYSVLEKCDRALEYPADDKLRQPHR